MPLVLKDRVRESSTSTGTGAMTLLGALPGFQPFSAIGVGNTTYYCITGPENTWETGVGTLSAASTLQRTTVIESSAGGSKVNFAAGVKDVFVTGPGSRFHEILDESVTLAKLDPDLYGGGPGELLRVASDGTIAAPFSGMGARNITSSETVQKSEFGKATFLSVELWGGGDGGTSWVTSGSSEIAGAIGGGYNSKVLRISDLPGSISAIVGAGGLGQIYTGTTQTRARTLGGLTHFGDLLTSDTSRIIRAGSAANTRRSSGDLVGEMAPFDGGTGGNSFGTTSSGATDGNGEAPGGAGGSAVCGSGTATGGNGARGEIRLRWW